MERHLKITDVELSSAYCYVAWLPHVVGTVKPEGDAELDE